MKSSFAQLTLLVVSFQCLSTFLPDQAYSKDLEVVLDFPYSESEIDTRCEMYLVRDGAILSHVFAADEGIYKLEQPDDGRAFTLIVSPKSYPLLMLENLLTVDHKLAISIQPIPPYQPFGEMALTASIERIRDHWLDIQKARQLVNDEEFHKSLNQQEIMLLGHKPVTILVPAYFYPDDGGKSPDWQQLFALAKRLQAGKDDRSPGSLLVILNVYDGSGTKIVNDTQSSQHGMPNGSDSNYESLIQKLDRARIPWLGYVAANYGKPKDNPLEPDIRFWLDTYKSASGIFVDECPTTKEHASGMLALREFIQKEFSKRRLDSPIILTNPGTNCPKDYEATASGVCLFEGAWEKGREIRRPDWMVDPASTTELAVLPYNVANKQDLQDMLNTVISQRVKYLFFTDQISTPNERPWTRMPRKELVDIFSAAIMHWNTQVQATQGILPARQRMLKEFLASPR